MTAQLSALMFRLTVRQRVTVRGIFRRQPIWQNLMFPVCLGWGIALRDGVDIQGLVSLTSIWL